MISCFIIDDEQSAVDILRSFIEKTPFLKLVGSTTNPVEALLLLQQTPADLVFLDVHMPQLSGLDVIQLLKGKCQIILTTAYSEFAVTGFELDVLDYLLKPIAFERFLKAAQKALNSSLELSPQWQLEAAPNEYIFVKTENKGKMVKIDFSNIVYVEGMKNYVSIVTGEENITTLLNIKDLEERLPARQFIRVHKSYIVSLDKIRAIDAGQILLKGLKSYVPLGETYRSAFFSALEVLNGRR